MTCTVQRQIIAPLLAGLIAILFGLWPGLGEAIGRVQRQMIAPLVARLVAALHGLWPGRGDAIGWIPTLLSMLPPTVRPPERSGRLKGQTWFVILGVGFLLLAIIARFSN